MWVPGYVEVVRAFDAEHCPDPLPEGVQAALVYAGGSSAAHAWDDQELARVAHLPRLPVIVPTPGHEDPAAVAAWFIQWLADHQVPSIHTTGGRPVHVMWDMETGQEPDAAWLNRAADELAEAGYWNLVYGSLSTLFGQPARDGYMVASPRPAPYMYPAPMVKGTQYADNVPTIGGQIDEWLVDRTLVGQLWLP